MVQIAANMLHIARVVMLRSNELKATDVSKAVTATDRARELLNNSIRSVLSFFFFFLKRQRNILFHWLNEMYTRWESVKTLPP